MVEDVSGGADGQAKTKEGTIVKPVIRPTGLKGDISFPDDYYGPAKRYSITLKTRQVEISDIARGIAPDWRSLAYRFRSEVQKKYPSVKIYHIRAYYVGATRYEITARHREGVDKTVYEHKFTIELDMHDSPIAPAIVIAIAILITAICLGYFAMKISEQWSDVYKQQAITAGLEAQAKLDIAKTGQEILKTQGFAAYMEWLAGQTKLAEAWKTGEELSPQEELMQKILFYTAILGLIGAILYIGFLVIERYVKKK